MDIIYQVWGIASSGAGQLIGLLASGIALLESLGVPVKWIWWTILIPYLLFSLTYVYYCAVIKMKSVWSELHWIIKTLMIPHVVVGFILDIAVNVIIGTVLGLEIPKELLFTARLKRWRLYEDGWRETLAIWICEKGLNPIDPEHC
jgi:hypothetical protein